MIDKLTNNLVDLPAKLLSPVGDLLALGVRFYVGWQFFKAGQIKIGSWSQTVSLFESTYEVPLLPAAPAAFLGTFGELFFPVLLWLGLTTRLSAIGLQFVNIVAMIAVVHFFDDGYANGAFASHYLWGLMLLMLTFYGGGRLSLDHLLSKRGKS
jgi:putative oxidoreductase